MASAAPGVLRRATTRATARRRRDILLFRLFVIGLDCFDAGADPQAHFEVGRIAVNLS